MEKIALKDFLKINKESLKDRIIVFPTDTVYGVAALFDEVESREKLYKLKNRSLDKPFAVLISDLKQVETRVKKISFKTKKIMDKYWPGPLTIILESNESQSLAVRIPDSKIALKILDKFGPMYATSINESGEKELNSIEEIYEKYNDKIDYLIIDKAALSKVASTVIEVKNDNIKVIRQGSIIIND